MSLLVPLENLVKRDHPYRMILSRIDFAPLVEPLHGCIKEVNSKYSVSQGFRMLLLQYIEDLSDRECERFLQENIAGKLFCGFDLSDHTPDHSYFGYLRNRIGLERLRESFNHFRVAMKGKGFINEVFTFVDASQLKSKLSLWEERDKAIKLGEERLHNHIIGKVTTDSQARIGCKGNKQFWFGYKRVVSVDMQSGMINKLSIVPANVHDSRTLKTVCPDGGAVYMDKGYCSHRTDRDAYKKGAVPRAIKRNNMKNKNRDLDRWLTGIRSPYERVFSKANKKARYIGIRKNLFAETFYAMAFNCKRLLKLPEPIPITF